MSTLLATDIPAYGGIDAIRVYWTDDAPGSGSVVVTCFGCAWTASWRAMGNCTVREFFMRADTQYLVSKLGITPLLKQRKVDHAYLARIIEAIKSQRPATPEPDKKDERTI